MSQLATYPQLKHRRIILGVTGSIAAYKIADLTRILMKNGAEVQILMTEAAEAFVTSTTLATLSRRPVYKGVFDGEIEAGWTKHVDMGIWADLIMVAPATAQTMAKLATGACDSMLTATVLSARCPVMVCPAMDHDMFEHPATQESIEALRGFDYHVVDPEEGELASGLIGKGRLPSLEVLVDRAVEILGAKSGQLAGKKVVVTAGPTREAIDPVRFVTNHSTGTMGFELAREAAERGADVILIAGPTTLETPPNVQRVDIQSAADMYEAVHAEADADLIIMAAAVADYAPVDPADQKIKKSGEGMSIELGRTKDILASLGDSKREGQTLIGFALETNDAVENGRKKLAKKNLDWIVVNDMTEKGAGFGTGTNKVTILGSDGSEEALPLADKRRVAALILDAV